MEAQLNRDALILAIETSGSFLSLALYRENLLGEITLNANRAYAKYLFKTLSFLFQNTSLELKDLDLIVVDIGPGSFTGLRIGLSMVKALTLVYDLPVLPILSLEALAFNFYGSSLPILSLIDAHSQELYVALYKFNQEGLETLLHPSLIALKDLKTLIKEPTLIACQDLGKWENFLSLELGENFVKPPFQPLLRAHLLCELAKLKLEKGLVSPFQGEEVLPFYLKASEAERKRCYTSS